jgi:uncharacterized protein YndB with AHSA1/START domain
MAQSDVFYTIHIASRPEKLWDALTSRRVLEKNWGKIESRWTVGSPVIEVDAEGKPLWTGEVVQSERPRRLGYTMIFADGPTTEVSFDLGKPVSKLDPDAVVVKLTVTQSGFGDNDNLAAGCARAWAEILSSIKSYIETGRPLGFAWEHQS